MMCMAVIERTSSALFRVGGSNLTIWGQTAEEEGEGGVLHHSALWLHFMFPTSLPLLRFGKKSSTRSAAPQLDREAGILARPLPWSTCQQRRRDAACAATRCQTRRHPRLLRPLRQQQSRQRHHRHSVLKTRRHQRCPSTSSARSSCSSCWTALSTWTNATV